MTDPIEPNPIIPAESKTDVLASLQALSQSNDNADDFNQLLETTLNILLDFIQFEAGALYLLSENNAGLNRHAHRCHNPELFDVIQAQYSLGEGLPGQAYDLGQAIFTVNGKEYSDLGPEESPQCSRVCLPLVASGQTVGVLDLHHSQPRCLTPEERQRLQLLCNYAAALILAARSTEKAQSATAHLIVFYVFGSRILGAKTLQQALEMTVRFIIESTPAHSVVVYLYDSNDTLVLHMGQSRQGELFFEPPAPTGSALTHSIQTTGRPVAITGLEPNAVELIPAHLREQGIAALLGLPLQCGSAPFTGALFVRYDKPHNFASMEMEGLRLFADQVSSVIEHLHLLDHSRQRQSDLELVIDTAHILTSITSRADLLEQISVRLIWVTNVDACAIASYDPVEDRVQVLAHYNSLGLPEVIGGAPASDIKPFPAAAELIQKGEHLVVQIDDPLADPAKVEFLNYCGYTSSLTFPITSLGRPIGAVELYSRQPGHQFTATILRRLKLLSEQIALALINARMYDEERRSRLTAETLRDAAAAVNSTLELHPVLNQILTQLQKVVHLDSASLILIDNQEFHFAAIHGSAFPEKLLNTSRNLAEDPLVAAVVQQKETIILPDAMQDERFQKSGFTRSMRGWMGIPLMERGELIGLLSIASQEPNAYTEEDARLALAFANQAAAAVTNARLFQSEKKQRSLAEALREISLALSTSLNTDAILSILLDQTRSVVPYDTASVLMVEGEYVQVAAHRGFDRFGMEEEISSFQLELDKTPNLRDMARDGRPQIINDVSTSPAWVHVEISRHVGSWIGVPLIVHERLLGFLALDKVEVGFYTSEHLTSLEILASHAALALLNAITFSEVESASITDFLTGTYNHRHFHQRLHEELARATRGKYPVSLLMADLDNFKKVNDAHGHPMGDQVLRLLAQRLRAELREVDILARYGGEEFAIILPGAPANVLQLVADRLLQAVANRPFEVEHLSIPMTISLGGSSFPDQASSSQELINLADQALYRAKSSGRNCFTL